MTLTEHKITLIAIIATVLVCLSIVGAFVFYQVWDPPLSQGQIAANNRYILCLQGQADSSQVTVNGWSSQFDPKECNGALGIYADPNSLKD